MINLLGGSQPDRYPCPWCGEPEQWPDLCSESVPGCLRIIKRRCMDGDHRRCEIDACTVSTRWHAEVSQAGAAAGAPFAVVSTIHNRVEVVGTAEDLDAAREALRTYALRDAEYMTMVYVINPHGGELVERGACRCGSAHQLRLRAVTAPRRVPTTSINTDE